MDINIEFSNRDDIIMPSDVVERVEYLKRSWNDATGDDYADYDLSEDDWAAGLGAEGAAELVTLMELVEEGSDLSSDWDYGEVLIRDSYFEDYARELAEDIGAVKRDAGWPAYCIDWERAARELQMDYSSVDFDGVTYWIRS